MKSKLATLDFTEHDTIEALRYLISMCEQNKISGMVFAVTLRNGRKRRHLFGATGRLASNNVEAAGMACLMQGHAVRHAIESED